MKYKREESFRYSFKQPLEVDFKLLIERNGGLIGTKNSKASVLDLSPNGLRLMTSLDLPVEHINYLLEVELELNDRLVVLIGKPVWKRKQFNNFLYGIEAVEDKKTKEVIIQELKQYVKKQNGNQVQ